MSSVSNVVRTKTSPIDSAQVFVILFGVGTSETEGIYSLRALSGDDGLPQDTIIAFECEDDAVRCVHKQSLQSLLVMAATQSCCEFSRLTRVALMHDVHCGFRTDACDCAP